MKVKLFDDSMLSTGVKLLSKKFIRAVTDRLNKAIGDAIELAEENGDDILISKKDIKRIHARYIENIILETDGSITLIKPFDVVISINSSIEFTKDGKFYNRAYTGTTYLGILTLPTALSDIQNLIIGVYDESLVMRAIPFVKKVLENRFGKGFKLEHKPLGVPYVRKTVRGSLYEIFQYIILRDTKRLAKYLTRFFKDLAAYAIIVRGGEANGLLIGVMTFDNTFTLDNKYVVEPEEQDFIQGVLKAIGLNVTKY